MRQIIPPASVADRILGRQKESPDTVYRLFTYCVQCPVEEGTLLYHMATKELLLLAPGEDVRAELIARWFLVPEGHDDRSFSDNLRLFAANLRESKPGITDYTILTTSDCNARCFYCYERGSARTPMREDTARRVARFIAHNAHGEPVKLCWFGGEPLYNWPVIDIICQDLTDAGISFRSKMISNGYLFDKELVEKAGSLWKLRHVQITLDGTEKIYNRTKAYIYDDANPFQRVLENIGRLLDARIAVSVRLNLSETNGPDLFQLSDDLAARFQGKKGLSVYSAPLYADSHPDEVYETRLKLQTYIEQLGLNHGSRLRRVLRVNACMADNPSAALILPNGELGHCEHFTDSEFSGHIDRPDRDRTMVESWTEPAASIPDCATCPCYPACIRLRKCPLSGCSSWKRRLAEEELQRAVRYEYRRYQQKGGQT